MQRVRTPSRIGKRLAPLGVVLGFCSALLLSSSTFGKTVTLQWATWGPPLIDRQLIEAFEKEHPNIRIEYISSTYSEYHQKMKVLAASGQAPDVFAVDGYYTAEFATAGLIRPIDDLMGRETAFRIQDYFPAALLDVQYRDKTYGLPYISAPNYMVYNLTHLNEAGLPPPDVNWNKESYVEYARKLTRTDGNRVTRWGSTRYLGWGSFWPWVWSEGGQAFDLANRKFALVEPQALEALQWLADLEHVIGVAGPGDFVRQTMSIAQMYPASFPTVTGIEWPFEWDVVVHPGGKSGQYGIWKGNVMSISPTTQHLEEAWTFLKFLLGPTSPGHEIYVRNKRFPPQTPDRRLWNVFQTPGSMPKSLHDVTILLASQYGRPLPRLLQWDAIVANTIGPALQRIQSGQMSAKVAMEQIRPVVEKLLEAEPRD